MGWATIFFAAKFFNWSRGFLDQGFHCASLTKVLLRNKTREMRWISEEVIDWGGGGR